MSHSVLDDWKVVPRLMMLAVTILTYQYGITKSHNSTKWPCIGVCGNAHRLFRYLDGKGSPMKIFSKIKSMRERFGEGTQWDLDWGKLIIIALCIYIAINV